MRISRHFKQLPFAFLTVSWNCLSLHLPIEGCAQWKVPLFESTVKWKTKLSTQNCSRNCACYRVVLLNLNYSTVMFSHWHKEEIILLVLFYTLWDTFKYFIHDFFSWGSQVTNLEQSVIRVFLAGGTYTIINQPSLALTVFLLNTCRQTQKLSSDDADCYQE